MNLDLDSQVLTLTCPECDYNFDEPIGELKADLNPACPMCNCSFQVEPAELKRGISTIQKVLVQVATALARAKAATLEATS